MLFCSFFNIIKKLSTHLIIKNHHHQSQSSLQTIHFLPHFLPPNYVQTSTYHNYVDTHTSLIILTSLFCHHHHNSQHRQSNNLLCHLLTIIIISNIILKIIITIIIEKRSSRISTATKVFFYVVQDTCTTKNNMEYECNDYYLYCDHDRYYTKRGIIISSARLFFSH